MMNLYWLAVQPTPYNFNLFKGLKLSKRIKFNFCYSYMQEKNLPFDFKEIISEEDYFFKKNLGVDFKIVGKALSSKNDFMVVGWNDPTKVLVMILRKLLHKRYYFWTDSVNVETTKSSNVFLFKFKKWLLKDADKIFTTGDFGVEKMIESGLASDRNKIVSLPFFVEIPEKSVLRNFNPAKETLQILQLARLVEGKGIYNTIKAIQILIKEGYKIVYSIGGVGEEKDKIKALILEENLQEHIILLGWLDAESKKRSVENAHVLIHAVDRHDPFPLVVLESLAQGLPVIGSKLAGSVSDRVISGHNGVVVKSDVQSIVNGIRKIFDEYNVNELSKNAILESKKWPTSLGLKIIEENIGSL